ncbi:MAG: hypothetical protein QW279_02705 [Candidatus Jordarchaeaceae archaeon]
MAFPCSENTVLVNTTHKMLSQLQQTNPRIVATIPTPKLENIFAYDTAFESWKLFLCQYKRPYYYKQRFYYYLNMVQNWKLHFWWQHFTTPCVFFPLVLTMSDQHLAQINPNLLNHVVFVDAMSVWPLSTMISVEKTMSGRLIAKYKIWHGPWVAIPYLYSWSNIELKIKSCEIGGIMTYRKEITESSRLLRETASSLRENVLPSWWRGRTETTIKERFEERPSSQFFDFTDKILVENRKRKKPTTIVSQSFKAFIYPMSI